MSGVTCGRSDITGGPEVRKLHYVDFLQLKPITQDDVSNASADPIFGLGPLLLGFPTVEMICQCVTEHSHDCGAILSAGSRLVSAHLRNEHALGGGGDSKKVRSG